MGRSIEEINLYKLKKMRFRATTLLVIMAVVFVVAKHFDNKYHNTIIGAVVAFSEASMVGGLADWFAVVALFRHPLGMSWIPHTAIIQRRKNEIGTGLSEFVVNNFLKDRIIKERLSEFDLVKDLVAFIESNKPVIAKSITESIPKLVEGENDKGLNNILKVEFTKVLTNINLSPPIAKSLEVLKASNKHLALIRNLMGYMLIKIEDNKELLILKVKENHGFFKRMIIDRFGPDEFDKIIVIAKSIAGYEDNQINKDFDKFVDENIDQFVEQLKNSKDMQEKVNNFKNDIFQSEFLKDTIPELIDKMRKALVLYSEENSDELQEKIIRFIDDVLIEKVNSSDEVKEKLNKWMVFNLRQIISIYKREVGNLIRKTISDWDEKEVAKKIEIQVGKDLQYIRINGTVIGGIVGLILYLLSSVIQI